MISVDLQRPGEGQIEGFFGSSVRVDNLRSTAVAVEHLVRHPHLEKPAIVAASGACVELAHDVRVRRLFLCSRFRDPPTLPGCLCSSTRRSPPAFALQTGVERHLKSSIPFGSLIKHSRRDPATGQRGVSLVGDVDGRDVVIVDDVLDTGEMLPESVAILKEAGARRVFFFATHGLLSPGAIDKLIGCRQLEEVIITNTIPLPTSNIVDFHKLSQLTVAPVLASAIKRSQQHLSLQALRVYDHRTATPRYRGQGELYTDSDADEGSDLTTDEAAPAADSK